MLTLAQFKEKTKQSGAVTWPDAPPLETFWRFEMKSSREDIWSYLSDTSRFNREIGLAKRTEREVDGKVIVDTTMIGIPQRWIEEPWTWIAGHTIASKRTYEKGLADKVHAVFDIHEDEPGAPLAVYIYFGWTPKNALWSWFLKATSPMLHGNFVKVFAKIDAHLTTVAHRRRTGGALAKKAPELPPRALAALEEHRARLLNEKIEPGSVNFLCDLILAADDLDLESIRVRQLAQDWNLDYKELLTTSLHATHNGLLKMSWKVTCPHCRGPRFSADSLGDIPVEAKCETCEVDFSTGAENAIEVIFHVHPSVRLITPALYCAAEPAKKAHIKVQLQVEAGAELRVPYSVPEGHYRARVIGEAWEFKLNVDSAMPAAPVEVGAAAQEQTVGTRGEIRFKNISDKPVLFVVENLWWENEILKPIDILSNPDFRDLFSQEHLSAQVSLHLGEQALLFTDVVGSTQMYADIGDAKAFAAIRTHFQDLFKVVRDHHGVVVKTIGDALMGSFPSLEDALEAAVDMQKCFPSTREDTPIRVRVSVHSGQVMAVHLNSGIDYFGSVVNFTAKIQGRADAHEIAMSKETYVKFNKHFGLENPDFIAKRMVERRRYLKADDVMVIRVIDAGNSQLLKAA